MRKRKLGGGVEIKKKKEHVSFKHRGYCIVPEWLFLYEKYLSNRKKIAKSYKMKDESTLQLG